MFTLCYISVTISNWCYFTEIAQNNYSIILYNSQKLNILTHINNRCLHQNNIYFFNK